MRRSSEKGSEKICFKNMSLVSPILKLFKYHSDTVPSLSNIILIRSCSKQTREQKESLILYLACERHLDSS